MGASLTGTIAIVKVCGALVSTPPCAGPPGQVRAPARTSARIAVIPDGPYVLCCLALPGLDNDKANRRDAESAENE